MSQSHRRATAQTISDFAQNLVIYTHNLQKYALYQLLHFFLHFLNIFFNIHVIFFFTIFLRNFFKLMF